MKGTKRKHRLLSILLSLMLVVGLMPAMSLTAFAANTITTVKASGIKVPVEGESIENATDSNPYLNVKLPTGQGYEQLGVILWYEDAVSDEAVPFNGTFAAGHKYYAVVELEATANYQFADNVDVLYEGTPYSNRVYYSNKRLTFTVEFTCITAIHGDIKLNLSGYEIGASAGDIEVTSTVNGVVIDPVVVYVSGSNTPYTGKFEPDVQYILALDFSTKPGYTFTSTFPNFWVSMNVCGESKSVDSSLSGPRGYEYHLPKLYTDYGITVNDVKVTSKNKDDIYLLEKSDGYKQITGYPGTVSYDPDTKTLRIRSVLRDPYTGKNQTIIMGNNDVNIVIEPMNDTYEGYVSGKLTIRNAKDVSIYCKKGRSAAIYGNADIRNVNNVKIICDNGDLTQGSLAVIDANDVFLSFRDDVGEPVLGQGGFRCNTLTVENKAHCSKFCQELFSFGKPSDKLSEKYIYEVKDKETGEYEVKEVLTDYYLEFEMMIPRDDCFRIRPEASDEHINRIYFDRNGGSGTMDSILCMEKNYTLPDCKFTPPEGKRFKGWSTSDTGEVITSATIPVNENFCLHAIWEDVPEHTHDYQSVTTKATTSKNGTVEKECSICGDKINETIYYPKTMKLSTTTYTYSGGVKKPAVSVIDANGKTVSSANYTVSYATGRKNVGRYKVSVTFKGDKYSGSTYTYFNINPKGTSISKVSGAKKAFTVKWKKQSSKMATSTITGYQIRYSTSSKMASAKTKTVKGYKYTSKKITKLSAKKKYYVQVRTYKTVSGKTYYSSWSGVKSVKTK